MKFSLQWLNRYVDLGDLLDNAGEIALLAERFTLSVAELEGYETVGAELDSVIVARIESCEQHPNADRLRVCQVNDGGENLRTIVCGAPNARPGLVTALALPGSKFNGFKIKVSKVRGVESCGMLCAPDELGLGEGHEGIWELPSDLSPGLKLAEVMPIRDVIFEVDNKSITHRPDLWGHYGIAREVAGLMKRDLKALDTEVTLGLDNAPLVDVTDTIACPRYCALKIAGVSVQPSPLWMQILLHRCETRAINNLVDTTNFVMLELGQPLHAFDAREIHSGQIIVRRAHEGEKVTTLDRQERVLKANDLLICDANRPVALAGVMGLENSEVRDDTTDLVLEAANFTSEVVRRTAVRLGLRTEASARFEKSLDPVYPKLGALRFMNLISAMCPEARVTSQMADVWPTPPNEISIDTSVSYINRRLGTTLSGDEVRGFLTSVAFMIEDHDGDRMTVQVPSFRATKDVSIQEDLVEEVGRLFGYDNIKPAQPVVELSKPYRHPMRTLQRKARTLLSGGLGFFELRNYSFDSEPLLDRIGRSSASALELKNPLSNEQRFLKTSLIPNTIAAIERSIAHCHQLKVYEIGRVFESLSADEIAEDPERLPDQPFKLCGALWRRDGSRDQQSILTADFSESDRAYYELKGYLESLSTQLNTAVSFTVSDGHEPVWMHPARCAKIYDQNGHGIGYLGGLHPDVLENSALSEYSAIFEINLEALEQLSLSYGSYEEISRYPAISYDLSIIVPEKVSYAELKRYIEQAHKSWVREVNCVGIYRGEPIPDGQKSVTVQIAFQNKSATLEMDQVNKVVDRLIKRLGDEIGGWIR